MLIEKAVQTSPTVFHCIDNVDQISENEIEEIKNLMNMENSITRICLHSTVEEKVHISVICTSNKVENRRHFHARKHEFIVPIEGVARLKYFDENGRHSSTLDMNSAVTKIIKIPKGKIHEFVVESDYFIFWEICEGPHSNDSTTYV